jgi:hypothetical protein
MLLFAAMTFGDVNAQNTDVPNLQRQIDIREDILLKTPLVEKGLPKLNLPARKFVRSAISIKIDKTIPTLLPDSTPTNKKTT